jgi:cell division protein FtsQ
MDYAVIEGKNPGLTWDNVRAKRKRKQGQEDKADLKSRGRKETVARVKRLFRALIWGTLEGIIVFALGAAAYLGYWNFTHSRDFAVTEVTVQGLQTLSQKQVTDWIGNQQGENILVLDVQALASRLKEHPWIRQVSIERTLPHTLKIGITERIPYARLQLEKMYLLDNYGVLLGEAEPQHETLPLIIGFAGKPMRLGENFVTDPILQGLHTMHYLNKLETFRNDPVLTFQLVGNHRGQFISSKRGVRIFMDLDTLDEGFRNFRVFLNALEENRSLDFQTVDLSFKDRVIVAKNPVNNGQQSKKH